MYQCLLFFLFFFYQFLDENREGFLILMENVSQKNIKNGNKPTLSRIIFAPAKNVSIQYKNISQLDQKFRLVISQHFFTFYTGSLTGHYEKCFGWLFANTVNRIFLFLSFLFLFFTLEIFQYIRKYREYCNEEPAYPQSC